MLPRSITERMHGATADGCRKLAARQVREEWRRQDRQRRCKAFGRWGIKRSVSYLWIRYPNLLNWQSFPAC